MTISLVKAQIASDLEELIQSLVKQYSEEMGEKIEINKIERIHLFKDQMIVDHDNGQVFHFNMKISI